MFTPTRHFSPVKLIVNRERKAAVMLNPKVLTLFTRDMMADGYKEFLGKDDPSDGRYRFWNVARKMPVAPVRDYLDFIRHPESYTLYGFVRNPYGRLVSAYKNKFYDTWATKPGHTDTDYPRSIRQKHIKRVRSFAAKHGLEGAEPGTLVTFDTFLAYIEKDPVGARDHHWCAQYDVLMADRLKYTRVFRIEDDKEEGFRTLARTFGFDEEWAVARLAKKRNPSKTSETFITEENLPKTQGVCLPDVKAFGYDPESWQSY
ncbi:sulfotransferase family 2 domain-containing protein [Celeribacter litoreus]|uniref:sulfotransferase family 2 domain-containing protein n=1 Tax=Celeribacter litoreus TaxID=2876714 RepID=UPI001CCE8BAC|nr:sulfotransferase family 2 domain-containing protein [Celeribacter litoreus]MCA0041903.1 sulfotransferase family protein [Celeribacter litoreus]